MATSRLHFKLRSQHMLELQFVSCLWILTPKLQELHTGRGLKSLYPLTQIQAHACVNSAQVCCSQQHYMLSILTQTSQPKSLLNKLVSAARHYRLWRLLNHTLGPEPYFRADTQSVFSFRQFSGLCFLVYHQVREMQPTRFSWFFLDQKQTLPLSSFIHTKNVLQSEKWYVKVHDCGTGSRFVKYVPFLPNG